LVSAIGSGRHSRIIVLELGPVAPAAARTAPTAASTEFGTAAKASSETPDNGDENKGTDQNSYDRRPPFAELAKAFCRGMIWMMGHILAISLFHAFIPAAERLGSGLHIVDDIAGK
jgi:hypothetical protein